jgi:hypothetical protein
MPGQETPSMNVDSARDDLAFLRALVAPDDGWQRQFGRIYSAAGFCYSAQMIGHAFQLAGLFPNEGPAALALGVGPTLVFLLLLGWMIRGETVKRTSASTTSRAVGAVFGAVGATNLVLIVTIGSVAWRLHSTTVWLIYPIVVMVLQGLAWLVAFMLRRRLWLLGVAAGWFAVGVSMAAFIDNSAGFVASAGVGMVAFMIAPGLFMARQAGRSA